MFTFYSAPFQGLCFSSFLLPFLPLNSRGLLEKRALFYPLIDLKFLSLDRFTFALAACQGGLSSTGGSVFC